ncbi:MAG: BrxE family protein [Mesorhizobium sp.]|nr:MAG: BrxE family protein [Mesorhizobium sp.]
MDYERLFKLRTVIARFGELDVARWWNSNGQLGRLGGVVLRRGFSRTYRFAQARSVFAIAGQKCEELFNPSGWVTLWKLPETIEEEFDALWERWLDQASDWNPFFERVETPSSMNLVDLLSTFGLVSEVDVEAYSRMRRSAEARSVPLPGVFEGTDTDIALLALGFARGEPGSLAVPYMKRPDA